jgi:hypothetical protein
MLDSGGQESAPRGATFLPEGGWGGDLVFREDLQRSDGTLRTRFLLELEHGGPPVPWNVKTGTASAQLPGSVLEIDSLSGYGFAALSPVPANARIRTRIRPSAGVVQYGLIVRGTGLADTGLELRLGPGRRRAEWCSAGAGALQRDRLAKRTKATMLLSI